MACFVEVTVRSGDRKIMVNMDLITSMNSEPEGSCLWRSGAEIHVQETVGQILASVKEANNGRG